MRGPFISRVATCALVVAIAVATMPLLAQAKPGDPAAERWPEVPAEAQAYHRNQIRQRVVAALRLDPEQLGFSAPVKTVDVGSLIPAYTFSKEFVAGTASATREAAFTETGEWLTAVSQGGRIRNVVSIANTGGSWDMATLGYGAELGARLAEIRPGDLVVYEFPVNAWFRVHGDQVSPLNTAAERVLPSTIPLAEFQGTVVARYADAQADPEGVMAGGGGAVRPAAEGHTWPVWLAVGAVMVVLAAALLARRRQTHAI